MDEPDHKDLLEYWDGMNIIPVTLRDATGTEALTNKNGISSQENGDSRIYQMGVPKKWGSKPYRYQGDKQM